MSTLRNRKELELMFAKAFQYSDGHYYDADECWYCGYQAGVKAAMLYALGLTDLEDEIEEGQTPRLGYNTYPHQQQLELFWKIRNIK